MKEEPRRAGSWVSVADFSRNKGDISDIGPI